MKTVGFCMKEMKEVTLQAMEPTPPTIADETEEKIDPSISEYYHWHWEVFSEKALHCFPPTWNKDHAIILKPGTLDTLDCKVYKQTETELQATKDFVHEALEKGYIKESNSPYTSPLFYCAKKDGKLHPIMDYIYLLSAVQF